ncbi:hypothetical protein DPX16_17676 [Anabarilius grahami]|uniref:Uncharacterized protein n=1 Tax=Anabarilius grahami TaxID=495550 RepID=A0A3N0YI56_ANAGA|nr:hypothetical protein DPX16_17676 [Anabarilius grahami]
MAVNITVDFLSNCTFQSGSNNSDDPFYQCMDSYPGNVITAFNIIVNIIFFLPLNCWILWLVRRNTGVACPNTQDGNCSYRKCSRWDSGVAAMTAGDSGVGTTGLGSAESTGLERSKRSVCSPNTQDGNCSYKKCSRWDSGMAAMTAGDSGVGTTGLGSTGNHVKELPCAKDHGGPKCPSVVPFKILHSEGPFEVASFEHFGLERPFNMAAMIIFTPKCPSEGDISRLERTVSR